jgi:hypothetical protein
MRIRKPFLCSILTLSLIAAGPLFAAKKHSGHQSNPTQEKPRVPFDLCFYPGTPIEVIQDYERRLGSSMLPISLAAPVEYFQFSDTARWTKTATNGGNLRQGDPTTLTWSIVPDGTMIPGYSGESASASNLKTFLNGIYGSQANWLPIFESIFNSWGDKTGITYVYEPNDDGTGWTSSGVSAGFLGTRGDLRIAGHRIDGNYNVLAYNFFPDQGDMVIDTSDVTFRDTSQNSRTLRNTLAHEHGHGLGLRHVCPMNETKLLEPYLSLKFDGPQHDDVLAANRAYGDNLEHNDSMAVATDLGKLNAGSNVNYAGLSIDDDLDRDFLKFQVDSRLSVSVTVQPAGHSYLSGPQNMDGSCSAGSTYDSLSRQDLGMEILDGTGASVATANAHPAGIAETLSNIALPTAPATYYVRVYGTLQTTQPQLYNITVTAGSAPIVPIVYESTDKTRVVLPANQVGTAPTSPFVHVPAPDALLFYQVNDGSGNPALIKLLKNGSAVDIFF